MQCLRSAGEESLANMEISNSAGRREMGDTRHRSSMALRRASWSESGETEGAREDCESLAWNMSESLSSSSTPRSGDVDAEVSEREALTSRSARREREREAMLCSLFTGRRAVICLEMPKEVVVRRRCGVSGASRLSGGARRPTQVVKQAVGGSTKRRSSSRRAYCWPLGFSDTRLAASSTSRANVAGAW